MALLPKWENCLTCGGQQSVGHDGYEQRRGRTPNPGRATSFDAMMILADGDVEDDVVLEGVLRMQRRRSLFAQSALTTESVQDLFTAPSCHSHCT
jgi:hypothetical protein